MTYRPKYGRWSRSVRHLCMILAVCGALSLTRCYIIDPVDQATAKDVNNKSFAFSNGAVFHEALAGMATTLAFSNNAAAFTLSSGGSTASGRNTFGSCVLTVTSSTYAAGSGPQMDGVITLEPCDYDSTDGTLHVGRGSIRANSTPETTSSGTGGTGTSAQATASDVNNLGFTFLSGAVFDTALTNVRTTLAFSNNAVIFTLTSTGGTASGSTTLSGSCILTVVTSSYSRGFGPQIGEVITLNPCTFNALDTTLTVSNNGLTVTSLAGG